MWKSIAIVLDRDGTINENTHYTHCIDDLYLCKDIERFFAAVKDIDDYLLYEGFKHNSCGCTTYILDTPVVTNQSGVALGYYIEQECIDFENKLSKLIYSHTLWPLIDFYHDWTDDDTSVTRKPNPGMLLQLKEDLNVERMYMIGDKDTDVKAGIAAGCIMSFNVTEYSSILDCLDIIKSDICSYVDSIYDNCKFKNNI